MAELLVPADVEVAVRTELLGVLPALGFAGPVGTQIPEGRPVEFLRVLIAGGFGRDLVTDSVTVTVESFAEEEKRASDAAGVALAALEAAGRAGSLGSVPCYRVQVFALPQNLPHPGVPDRFRYQFTVSVDLRRTRV